MAEQQLVDRALEKDLQLEMLEAARTNFKSFFMSCWDLIAPGYPYKDNWSVDCIAEHLQAVKEGQIQNLILQVPPRNSKSSLASVAYPCWVWIDEPQERFITASAIEKLVVRDAVASRRLLGSEWYKKLNPELALQPDVNMKTRYENTQGGYRYATSIGSSVIGEGYSTLICDDLLRPQDINSKAVMEKTIEWWTQSIATRRNSPEAKRILIMQRLHEMDPIGYELSSNPDSWTNVMLPMEYDPARKLVSTIGWEDPRKEEGEILWPERFPPKEINNLKKTLGIYGWASQYNQSPIPKEGGLVKRNWLKYYFQPINKFQLVQFELLIGSWDLTFTDTGSSDCCGTVWGKRGTDKYLLACYKEKMDVVQQLAAIRKMKADFPGIRALLIEKKANGDAVIRMLQKEIPGLIAISPQEIGGGDKEVRLAACSIEYEAGNVYFPDKSFAPWVSEAVSELVNFPKAASDDFVDSSTQALNWLSTKSGLSSINVTATAEQLRHETGLGQDFDWYRRKTEKELEKTTAKMITESGSQNINSLKSIFS